MKYIIITADDLGLDIATNRAIFEGYKAGVISASSIIPNSESLGDAVKNVVKPNPSLDIGIQLNITEGKSLITNYDSYLTSDDGFYNNSWKKLLLFSNNNNYLKQIKAEFTSQIEYIISLGIKPSYLCSHHNIHIIPQVFNTVCELAVKYNINNVRTLTEIPYIVPEIYRHAEGNYISRIIKNLIYNTSTKLTQPILSKYELNTNDYYIGTLYDGQMDKDSVIYGLEKVSDDTLTEITFHPTTNRWKHLAYLEYKTLINPKFKEKINTSEYNIITWSELTNNIELSEKEGNKDSQDEITNHHTEVNKNEAKEPADKNMAQEFESKNRYETIVHSIKINEKPNREEDE